MPKQYKSVTLLGVPYYRQGEHDSLCTYYAAAMLLATLHPEYQDLFGRGALLQHVGLKVKDPLIKNFPRNKHATYDHVLASWFYSGAYLHNACTALNKSMREREDGRDTHFKHAQCSNSDNTAFKLIVHDIDQGLPVMIGWKTVDYGVHCALVVGYRKASRHWLILHDPGGSDEVCWEVLKAISQSDLTLVRVDKHDGPRPDRLTVVTNANNVNVRLTQIDRWWPHEGEVCYRPIAELYQMAKDDLPRGIE